MELYTAPTTHSAPSTRPERRHRGERAQSLVEFALVLPVFLIIIMATIDFGWCLRAYIQTTNAAREGARLAALGYDEDYVISATVSRAGGILEEDDVSVDGEGGTPGSPVTVTVDYNYNYITPLGGLMSLISAGTIPKPLPLSTATTMRLE